MPAAVPPMPADFPTQARGLKDKQSLHRWGVSRMTLLRWKHEAGLARPYRHPTPPRELVQRLTDTMTQIAAAKEIGVSLPTWRKMQAEAGVQRGVSA